MRALGSDSTSPLETSSVLLYVAYLVVFVIVLEHILHTLEHAFKAHRKYADMLHKITQELMIVGLIYLVVKFCLFTGIIEKGGLAYQAMDAADILVFFLSIALVIQSIIIFLRLRRSNKKMDRISIVTAKHLGAEATEKIKQAKEKSCFHHYIVKNRYEERIHMKILGQFFLNTFNLPHLFSFPKYIREVQDSQIAHLIEIDVTVWLFLLGIYALFFECTGELITHGAYKAVKESRILVFACFGVSLTLAMGLLLTYLQYLIQLLLVHAIKMILRNLDACGIPHDMSNFDSLQEALKVVEEQEELQRGESISEAIAKMKVSEGELAKAISETHFHRFHCINQDLLLQLISSGYNRFIRKDNPSIGGNTLRAKLTKEGEEFGLRLPFFSRKLVNFMMQLFLIINGFYFVLLFNCVMYIGSSSATNTIWVICLFIPLLFNIIFLAPKILRKFSLLNGTWIVDPKKLRSVIEHFVHVEIMKQQMISQITTYLTNHQKSVWHIKEALEKEDANDDVANDGFVDMDVLRNVLKRFGFTFSRHKFHTFVRLEFETKGKTIRFNDLFKFLDLNANASNASMYENEAVTPVHGVLLTPS
ncbi:hypothetical protein THRCLA_05113 [Thraustotheca clavata]|uniref:EF-hand domain-containing protein n=1 Tax=Thraustotheca clavata TaxID=74557 RepID=A0A1V9ZWW0_9STRA|nr:hypothetical protein THRCLA_05113 [Thraustotheca clavata]